MIHEAYSKSEIAKRYYKEATGEDLTNQEAVNRWRMLRNPDVKILKKVNDQIHKEQNKLLHGTTRKIVKYTRLKQSSSW